MTADMARLVRALEWHKSNVEPWMDDWHSIPTEYTIRYAYEDGWKWARNGGFGYEVSPEAAQAAAQADYTARVLAAIDLSPIAEIAREALGWGHTAKLLDALRRIADMAGGE